MGYEAPCGMWRLRRPIFRRMKSPVDVAEHESPAALYAVLADDAATLALAIHAMREAGTLARRGMSGRSSGRSLKRIANSVEKQTLRAA